MSKHMTALRRTTPPAYSDGTVTVDFDNGVIKNVNLGQVGVAKGHGFEIDDDAIQKIVDLVNAAPEGVKCRAGHPAEDVQTAQGVVTKVTDDFGKMVGRVKNARVERQAARGDIYLGDYARNLPGLGNMRDYILQFADSDPTGFGMSVMMDFSPEPLLDAAGNPTAIVARPIELFGIDFVGTGAITPTGLLAVKHPPATLKANDDGCALLHLSSVAVAGSMLMGALLGLDSSDVMLVGDRGGRSIFSVRGNADQNAVRAMNWACRCAVGELAAPADRYLRRTGNLSFAAGQADRIPVKTNDSAEHAFIFNPLGPDHDSEEPDDDELVGAFRKAMPQVQQLALQLLSTRCRTETATLEAVRITSYQRFNAALAYRSQ